MNIDWYRFAFNVFHCNWQRFGVPEEEIPDPKTEEAEFLDEIIPSFAKVVAIYQISARSGLKTFFDQCPKVHNLDDFYTIFNYTMQQFILRKQVITKDLPTDTLIEDLPMDSMKEDASEDVKMKDQPETAMKEDPSEISKEASEDVKMKDQPETAMKEDPSEITMETSEDVTEEDASEGSKKESLSEDSSSDDSKIKPEKFPELIAILLAACTELILYQYEDHKKYMENIAAMWKEYFDEILKEICNDSGCTLDHLKAFSESIICPENSLNKFISENKDEYDHILEKFQEYSESNNVVPSPVHHAFIAEVAHCPKGMSFAKIRAQFRAFRASCHSTKCTDSDISPTTPTH